MIEPLEAIEGAERYTIEGLGIDVPVGMEAASRTLDDGSQQVELRVTAEDRAAVIVTVTAQQGATPTIIDATSDLTAIQVTGSGAASNLVRSPVSWEGMPYAVAITTDLDIGTDGAEDIRQGILLSMSNPDESQVIGISVDAPQGEIETSEAYAALRTVRFDG